MDTIAGPGAHAVEKSNSLFAPLRSSSDSTDTRPTDALLPVEGTRPWSQSVRSRAVRQSGFPFRDSCTQSESARNASGWPRGELDRVACSHQCDDDHIAGGNGSERRSVGTGDEASGFVDRRFGLSAANDEHHCILRGHSERISSSERAQILVFPKITHGRRRSVQEAQVACAERNPRLRGGPVQQHNGALSGFHSGLTTPQAPRPARQP